MFFTGILFNWPCPELAVVCSNAMKAYRKYFEPKSRMFIKEQALPTYFSNEMDAIDISGDWLHEQLLENQKQFRYSRPGSRFTRPFFLFFLHISINSSIRVESQDYTLRPLWSCNHPFVCIEHKKTTEQRIINKPNSKFNIQEGLILSTKKKKISLHNWVAAMSRKPKLIIILADEKIEVDLSFFEWTREWIVYHRKFAFCVQRDIYTRNRYNSMFIYFVTAGHTSCHSRLEITFWLFDN